MGRPPGTGAGRRAYGQSYQGPGGGSIRLRRKGRLKAGGRERAKAALAGAQGWGWRKWS